MFPWVEDAALKLVIKTLSEGAEHDHSHQQTSKPEVNAFHPGGTFSQFYLTPAWLV